MSKNNESPQNNKQGTPTLNNSISANDIIQGFLSIGG